MTPEQKKNIRQEKQAPAFQPVIGPRPSCPKPDHSNHLCGLIAQGILQHDPHRYRSMVEHANFTCERCGVTADSAENLCWPIPLKTYLDPTPQSPWKRFTHNLKCFFQHHPNHLCYMMYEGFHERQPAQYKELVEHPKFVCQTCYRTAAKKENLCNPIPLP